MSSSGVTLNSVGGSPITVSGLASGLDTSSIIAALMGVEREPLTRLSDEQSKLKGEQSELQSIQSSLQQLSYAVSEFALPSLFEDSQEVTSNEPDRVSAAAGAGAAIGGYEVEVTALANSAQRTFSFTSPASEDTITIEGQEFKLKAGASAKELADAINSDSKATVYAAVLSSGEIVLSNRATGETGAEFIQVSDPGGALSEKPGSAKPGQDAEFSVDGTVGTSSTNTVTDAIPGVTLTLAGLTPDGPVTIDVKAPGPSTSAIEAKVQSFIKLYNSTVEAIETQLSTRPPAKPAAGELATGSLFGDVELTGVLNAMRQSMYEPVANVEDGIDSPLEIGISTGAPTGAGATSQSSLDGLLALEPSKLSEALDTNPAGVEQMLTQWSSRLQESLNDAGGPGGSLEVRVNGDTEQVTQLATQIANMNEMLALREKSLQETYAQLESVISQNTAQASYLTKQFESLNTSND
ncbi:MAG TPA: flagellar filament capping protein FliD [Solirubrobacteraceae bacterium]|nr:flagellar filament capping protein FliD [Solirubrobacteraceae bacterium]